MWVFDCWEAAHVPVWPFRFVAYILLCGIWNIDVYYILCPLTLRICVGTGVYEARRGCWVPAFILCIIPWSQVLSLSLESGCQPEEDAGCPLSLSVSFLGARVPGARVSR